MAKGGRRHGTRITSRKGVFNPDDATKVKHTKIGVWDLYEEKEPELENVPMSARIEKILALKQDLPYLWMMLRDIGSIRSCWWLLLAYMAIVVVAAMVPAVSLWYKGQMLQVVQTAVDTRTVDKSLLFRITLGSTLCKVAERFFRHYKERVMVPLRARLRQHYTAHSFHARARLDVPTFDDPAVQRQLDATAGANGGSVAWSTLHLVSEVTNAAVRVISQISVLIGVLRNQPDGPLLAVLSVIPSLSDWVRWQSLGFNASGVWAATTKDEHFIKIQGLKRVVTDREHRQEFVAGNMAESVTQTFKKATQMVGDYADGFWETIREFNNREKMSPLRFLHDCLGEIPQIVFALRAVQRPASIPASLASLNLISSNATNLSFTIYRFFDQTGSVADQLSTIRKLYQITNIPNKIPDGTIPFPENAQSLKAGISLEFRNVSFTYPGAQDFALRDVSFKMHQGQLCVIVGSNGSGKSTILKLIVRLYDPQQGQILLNGQDIRTLKLVDLRNAISVLFQDFTHFPLSIRDNIALGDPANSPDDGRIRQAAFLGGSEEFVDRLPDGFDTYLERPVIDFYGGLPEGTKTLFGRPVDYQSVRNAGGMASSSTMGLSGGQLQRLALSRMFMRSVVSDDSTVGLLLFDEPSASLDPTAEHDLFRRLRELRGNKTMIFSSHRFGNLTRHADLIMYMNDSRILETGTHEELLKKDGDYARIWMLQAQAFL